MLALITNVEPFQPIQLPTFIPSLRKRGWDIRVDPLALSRLFLGKLDLREAWKLIEIRLSFFFKSISSFFRFICCVIHQCRSEEHTSELQSRGHLVCRLLLEKK